MGQLEKYGLYVLCLVIFLILGVAIWGEPAHASTAEQQARTSPPARGVAPDKATPELDLKALMSPVGKPGPAVPAADAGSGGRPESGKPDAKSGDGKAGEGKAAEGKAGEGKAEHARSDKGAESAPAPKPESHPLYIVKSGDTLESIARQKLGDSKHVALLEQLNPKVQPARLQIGQEIVLPTAAELAGRKPAEKPVADAGKAAAKVETNAATKPDARKPDARSPAGKSEPAAGTRTYSIAQGDTLEGLAKRLYGSAKRLDDIKELNPTVDPTRLRIGQVIRLPAR